MLSVVQLKSKLVEALRDLKNDKFDVETRKSAYAHIVTFSDELSKLEPTFKMRIDVLEKYKEFKSKEIVPRVVWPELTDDLQFTKLEKYFEKLTALAVKITKKRLPRELQDSQLFGMIVSATTDKLIELQKALVGIKDD